MPMLLKLNEDKNAVVIEGKPVYVDDDNKDIEVDVPQLFEKIKDLNSESKTRRLENSELKESYKMFEGIDDLSIWKEEADKAIDLSKNIDESKLIQAGKVDELKSSMKKAFEDDKENLKKSFEKDKSTMELQLVEKNNTIFDLMVTSKFAQSPMFSGKEPKTILPPEIAAKYFGHQFKVEKDELDNLRVVGYNLKGTQIYSRKNPGEIAEFEEAVIEIIDEYPLKNRIMRGGDSGSGGSGGGGGEPENELDKLKIAYSEALKNKNTTLSIALKNKIFILEGKTR